MKTLDSVQRWKQAIRKGETPADEKLFVEVAGAVLRDANAGPDAPVTMVMSTAAVDRVDDTIAVEGWKLDNYKKNPVVLFAHDSRSLPVGRMENVRIAGDKLLGDCVFTRDHGMGVSVEKLVRGGFLNAGSVGFRPIKYVFNEERGGEGWMPPCDFIEQELLEHSVVPVPANPEALVAGKAAGIDMAPIVAWAEKTLDLAGGGRIVTPGLSRATIEAVRRELGAQKLFFVGATKDAVDGDPAPAPTVEDGVACACGHTMQAGDKFCAMCGLPVTAPAKAEPEEPDDENDDDDEDDDEMRAAIVAGVKQALAL